MSSSYVVIYHLALKVILHKREFDCLDYIIGKFLKTFYVGGILEQETVPFKHGLLNLLI